MRISDWSSDVCSSDLFAVIGQHTASRSEPAEEELLALNWSTMLLPILGTSGEIRIGDIHLGVAINAGTGMFHHTRVVTLSPRFVFVNYTSMMLELCTSWRMEARSEEHTSELQSLMRISYAVFCLKKKKYQITDKM